MENLFYTRFHRVYFFVCPDELIKQLTDFKPKFTKNKCQQF